MDVGTVIPCCGAGGTSVWVRDVGYVPTHWDDAGWLPPQGGTQVYRATSKEEDG